MRIRGNDSALSKFCCSVLALFHYVCLSCRRFMLNDTLFSELVEASRDIPGNRWAVGGNAPVMAGRMATEGCDVLLGGSFSPDFTDVLSQHITGTHTHTHTKPLLPPRILFFIFYLMHFLCPLHFLFPVIVLFTSLAYLRLSSGRQRSRRARHSSDPGVSIWC